MRRIGGNIIMKETIEHISLSPKKRLRETPLFFQHGLFHGASCWKRFLDYFCEMGYETHAISLPGHGSSSAIKGRINNYSFKDYMDCMNEEIAKVSPLPILIGHSLGGLMSMKYLESHKLPGAVLMASTPHRDVHHLIFRLLRRHPRMCLGTLFGWNLKIPDPVIARDLFLSPSADVNIEEFFRSLCADSMKMGNEVLFKIRPMLEKISAPILVLAGERDACFTVEEERRLAEVLRAKFIILPDQAHDMMLEPGWQSVAETIHKWIIEDLKLP